MGLFSSAPAPSIEEIFDTLSAVSNHRLVDVRSPQEYQAGHLPGSVNVPLNQLPTLLQEVPDRDTPLYVYCQSGARSRRACAFLTKQGYTHVTDMGGLLQWNRPLATD